MSDSRKIPNVVTAKSVNGLRRAMLRNNARKGYAFHYHDIQFVNGTWYAWYHDEITSTDIEEMSSDAVSRNNT